LAFARRTWLFSLCLWLSLATVLGHALSPIGSPLSPRSGSAFSASTWDVSLGAGRTGINAKLKRGQTGSGDDNGPADPPDPLLAAAALSLPAPVHIPAPLAETYAYAPAPFGPGGGLHARAPPRA
jgi:hypothetical protein